MHKCNQAQMQSSLSFKFIIFKDLYQNEALPSLHAGGPKLRTQLKRNQTSVLAASFMVKHFPNKTTVKELALQTGVREEQVSRWFRNARHRTRQRKCGGILSMCKFACC